jgi:mitochondrial fission protein ELM1
VARWIGEQSRGRTRLVQLGRRGGESVDAFDLVVACAHFRLPLHARRMQIVAPLNAVTPEGMAQAAERWRGLFGDAPRPHIVLVAGGTCARHLLDAETARRMGNEVRAWAESLGGSVFAITSRRTGPEATAALRRALGDAGHLHEWRAGEIDNPYMGHLALADAIIVTGESESMLAEAAAAAKPLFIYPLPERSLKFRRIAEWIAARAESRPRKAKGTVRPQQGLEYLCARLIAAGVVRPPRHLDRLHEGLVGAGAARYFGAPLDAAACRPLRDVETVARRVRLLLGFAEPSPAAPRAANQPAATTASATPFIRKHRDTAAGAERSRRSTAA